MKKQRERERKTLREERDAFFFHMSISRKLEFSTTGDTLTTAAQNGLSKDSRLWYQPSAPIAHWFLVSSRDIKSSMMSAYPDWGLNKPLWLWINHWGKGRRFRRDSVLYVGTVIMVNALDTQRQANGLSQGHKSVSYTHHWGQMTKFPDQSHFTPWQGSLGFHSLWGESFPWKDSIFYHDKKIKGMGTVAVPGIARYNRESKLFLWWWGKGDSSPSLVQRPIWLQDRGLQKNKLCCFFLFAPYRRLQEEF